MPVKYPSQIFSSGAGATKVQSCWSVDSQSGALNVSCQPNATVDGLGVSVGGIGTGEGAVSLMGSNAAIEGVLLSVASGGDDDDDDDDDAAADAAADDVVGIAAAIVRRLVVVLCFVIISVNVTSFVAFVCNARQKTLDQGGGGLGQG